MCKTFNYFEHFVILVSAVAGCISICYFLSLFGTPMRVKSSGIKLKVCAITAAIKKYEPIIKKKWRNMTR